jgi:hypothetical protein
VRFWAITVQFCAKSAQGFSEELDGLRPAKQVDFSGPDNLAVVHLVTLI